MKFANKIGSANQCYPAVTQLSQISIAQNKFVNNYGRFQRQWFVFWLTLQIFVGFKITLEKQVQQVVTKIDFYLKFEKYVRSLINLLVLVKLTVDCK